MERNENEEQMLRDFGPSPIVVDIDGVADQNTMFRTALWTGEYMQLTLMSLMPEEDIGLEMHSDLDQFLRIEDGIGHVMMGESENDLSLEADVDSRYAIIIPAGKWHNLINIGDTPLKLYSIYAPPSHPFGTVHATKEIAEEAERNE